MGTIHDLWIDLVASGECNLTFEHWYADLTQSLYKGDCDE